MMAQGDIYFPDGFFGETLSEGGIGTAPAAPTISLTISGTTVTATFTTAASVTNYLFYKRASDTAWTSGGSRSGSGDIAVTSLSTGVRYSFVGYSRSASAGNSQPSLVHDVVLASAHTSMFRAMEAVSARQTVNLLGAEPIAYEPAGGGSRAILGIIDRDDAQALPGAPHGNSPGAEIGVLNHADDGISSAELDKNLDRIRYPVRIGEIPQSRKIIAIVSMDAGMITLRVA